MIKNIIFDIGNVLADFRFREFIQDKGYSEEMTKRIVGATVLSAAWLEVDRGVWPDNKIMEAFIENDPQIEDEIRNTFTNVKELVTPRAYAIPWIQELKGKGYGVYYLSNFSKRVEIECREAINFLPYMDGGIFSYQEQLIKPDPAIYRLLMKRYQLVNSECVFLDDTEKNVQAAKKEGMEGIWFQTYDQSIEELKQLGVV